MGRDSSRGKILPEIKRQAEKIKEKIKVAYIDYVRTEKPTIEFIVEKKPTTEFIPKKVTTKEFIAEKVPTTEFIRNEKSTTEFIRKAEPTTEFIRETKPTTEFVANKKDTTEFIKRTEDTIKYLPKIVEYSIEEVVQNALDTLLSKNKLTIPSPNFKEVTVNVFKLECTCPKCEHKFFLGGVKK